MMKKVLYILVSILTLAMFLLPQTADAADYGRRLSRSERQQICNELRAARQQRTPEQKDTSLGGGIIPDTVLSSIYNTTRQISDSVSLVMVLGHALTCNAVHANKQRVTILGVQLFSYPNLPVWFCGAIIYFIGFMLTLSVTFYLVDIAFKLGFAVIALPIGVALWPFPPTKSKLTVIISIILKNAAVFAFLAITVSYALNLIGEAGGGLEDIFKRIDRNETDTITEDFSLASTNFLIVLFALVYGMKLIGSTIEDYVDQFFPDKAFGGGQKASPMHGSMTQAMDFAKKKAVAPAAAWAGDVAKTQMGRATVATGKLLTGGYNQQIKKAAHYATHPGEAVNKGVRSLGNTAGKAIGGATRFANRAVMGTVGRAVLGKNASQDIRNRIDNKINAGVDKLNQATGKAADKISQPLTNASEKFKQTRLAQGMRSTRNALKKSGNAIQKAYDNTINAFDRAQQGVDKIRDRINNPADRIKNDIYNKINQALGKKEGDSKIVAAGKAVTRGMLKAPVAVAAGVAKAPAAIAAGVAKAPIKVLKTATQAAYVKNWAKTGGNILMRVGEKMQHNKKPAGWSASAAQTAREEEERARQEEEERRKYNQPWS